MHTISILQTPPLHWMMIQTLENKMFCHCFDTLRCQDEYPWPHRKLDTSEIMYEKSQVHVIYPVKKKAHTRHMLRKWIKRGKKSNFQIKIKASVLGIIRKLGFQDWNIANIICMHKIIYLVNSALVWAVVHWKLDENGITTLEMLNKCMICPMLSKYQ